MRLVGPGRTVHGVFTEEFTNDIYDVSVTRMRCPADGLFPRDPMVRIGVGRCDGGSVVDWRDLQCIKNDVAGPEWEAIELYPAESRLIDPSNYRILWAFQRIPLGMFGRRNVLDANDPACIAPQRPQRGQAKVATGDRAPDGATKPVETIAP